MGRVGDAHEQQADAMAEKVVKMTEAQVRAKGNPTPLAAGIQRKAKDDKDIKRQAMDAISVAGLQKKANEEKLKKTADEKLQKKMNDEKETKKSADEKLQKKMNDEKEVKKSADEKVQKKMNDEKELKKSADEKLQKKMNDEKEIKKSADEKMQKKMNDEKEIKKKSEEPIQRKVSEEKIQKIDLKPILAPKLVAMKTVTPLSFSSIQKKEEKKVEKQEEKKLKKTEEKIQKAEQKKDVQPMAVAVPRIVSLKEEKKLEKKEEKKLEKTGEKIQKTEQKKDIQPMAIAAPRIVSLKEEKKLEKKEEKKIEKTEEKIQKAEQKKDVQPMAVAAPRIVSLKEEKKLEKKEEKKLEKTENKIQKAEQKKDVQPMAVAASRIVSLKEEKKLEKSDLSGTLQREAAEELDPDHAPEGFEQKIAAAGEGRPLDSETRVWMENRFQVGFSQVRIHTDGTAARLCQEVGAHAFAYGAHIFFNTGKYNPTSEAGRFLLAHELTHVIQQGFSDQAPEAEVQRVEEKKPQLKISRTDVSRSTDASIQTQAVEPRISKNSTPKIQRVSEGIIAAPISIQRLGWNDVNNVVRRVVPVWTLLTVIMGYNPIISQNITRDTAAWFGGLLDLIPLVGPSINDKLRSSGLLDRAANWFNSSMSELPGYTEIKATWDRCWSAMSLIRGVDHNIGVFRQHFNALITRIVNFARRLLAKVVELLREPMLRPLDNVVKEIPGWELITVLIGTNPLTGEVKQRNAANVMRGVAAFIPNGTEKVNQLIESRALEKAYKWFTDETTARNLTWARIRATFTQAWDSLQASDILHPIETFRRLGRIFSPLLTDLVAFAVACLEKLLEFIYEAAMGAGGTRILNIVKRSRTTFMTIIRNPVGFLRNLVTAVGQGVRNFSRNIMRHLQTGVITWLTGTLGNAGVQLPTTWDLKGVVMFIMGLLGITWPNIRTIAVRVFGAPVVTFLETAAGLIMDIREKGFVQAMKDRISEYFNGLKEMVLGKIKSFIQERIVMSGIQYLISMLSPVGAVIQAIIKTYQTVMFFVEKINQILDFVESVVNSISNIANGSLGQAAAYIEQTMARTIPLILDFLARMIGLGNISGKVKDAIATAQQFIAQKIEQGMLWIKAQMIRLLGAGTPLDPNERLREASNTALRLTRHLAGRRVGEAVLRPILAGIKLRYQLKTLEPIKQGNKWAINAEINPTLITPLGIDAGDGTTNDIAIEISKTEGGPVSTIKQQSSGSLARIGSKRYRQAYLANVPVYFGNPKSPIDIANQYKSQAFNNPIEASRRFSLVVGINGMKDVLNKNDEKISQRTTSGGWSDYPLGVFGFMWQPLWKYKNNPVADIRTLYANPQQPSPEENQKLKDKIIQTENEFVNYLKGNKSAYPYGQFRDAVKNHPYTGSFIGALQQRAKNVFLHTGDPDAISLRGTNEFDNPNEAFSATAGQVGTGLFNRYDQYFKSIKGRYPKGLPLIVSGGYVFKVKTDIEAASEAELASTLASLLDNQIRVAMSRINALAVYFPEPNTLFNVTKSNKDIILNATYGKGGTESRANIISLIRQRGLQNISAEYDQINITTGLDPRFVLTDAADGINKEMTISSTILVGYLRPNTRAIEALLAQDQSHGDGRRWANQVGLALGFDYGRNSSRWQDPLKSTFNLYYQPVKAAMDSFNADKEKLKLERPDVTESLLRDLLSAKISSTNLDSISAASIFDANKTKLIAFLSDSKVSQLNNVPYSSADLEQLFNNAKSQAPLLAKAAVEAIKRFIINGLTHTP
ncbi:MAG: eCIS core domain-containing protein [Bacteroidia bacterium]